MMAVGRVSVLGAVLSLSIIGEASAQISAILLKPWGPSSWSILGTSWSTYGATPVTVNMLLTNPITLAALSAANPDVLVFSDCAGGSSTFTAAEQADITLFLTQGGKRAVTTFAAFYWGSSDNRWLLPLCGFAPSLGLGTGTHGGAPIMALAAAHPVMAGMPPSYVSGGYTDVQYPADMSWDPGDYTGQLIAADTSLRQIVHYYGGTTHDAVMISFMPEFGGNSSDLRLMYNALTAVVTNASMTITPQGTPNLGGLYPLSLAAPGFPNQPYLMAFAATTVPGILLADGRTVPLTPDALFWLSLTPGNSFFLNTSGVLDGGGNALTWTLVAIPNLPALLGVTMHAAAVTGGPGPSGVGGISSALPITFVP